MPSIFRNGSIYLLAAALNVVIPFLALPIIVRELSPHDFGQVGAYLAIVNIATVVVGLSVHGIVSVVHFRDGQNAVPAYVRGAMRLAVMTGVPLIFLSAFASIFFGGITGIPSAWAWTAVLVAMTQFIIALAMAVFQAREQPLSYASLQVGTTIGWALISIGLISGIGMGWEGRIVGQIFATLIMSILSVFLLYRSGVFNITTKAVPIRTLLNFGMPLVPHSLAGALIAGSDRLFLSSFAGQEAAGLYFAAFQVCAVITVGAAAINQAWIPWLYRRLANGELAAKKEIVRATLLLNVLFITGGIVVAALGPFLIHLVAGDKYTAAAPLMQWLAPAAAFSGMYYFVTNYIFYIGRTGVLSAITVSVALLQIALLYFSVPRWGIEGAAISTLITSIAYWLITWFVSNMLVPMPWVTALSKDEAS